LLSLLLLLLFICFPLHYSVRWKRRSKKQLIKKISF